MDNMRGNFSEQGLSDSEALDFDLGEDETAHEPPPLAIGQDERRMQVRAYNFWSSLLDNRNFPAVEDLDPEDLPDFGPHSVLLDFTSGIENPAIPFLGKELAKECGTDGEIHQLSDVPSRSLLSRITDHYMQILANQAPIGFEAEFVNQRGSTILYRGILLPFSSDDDTIDFIYGVINWKELADQQTTDALMLEIDQAIEAVPELGRDDGPLTEWADGPEEHDDLLEPVSSLAQIDALELGDEVFELDEAAMIASDNTFELAGEMIVGDDTLELDEAEIVFGEEGFEMPADDQPVLEFDAPQIEAIAAEPVAVVIDSEVAPAPEAGTEADSPQDLADAAFEVGPAEEIASETGFAGILDPVKNQSDSPAEMELADWLASARELALAAQSSDDRSRQALYAAIGRAYDFSIAAAAAPEDFAELAADAGLTVQDRAPMTPVVKLVFGSVYDKTRLAEYASALSHGQRLGVARGALADYLAGAPGGLKGVVTAERQLRREETGKLVAPRDTPRAALSRKLRKLDHTALNEIAAEGPEFTLLVARRLPDGQIVLLGEVSDDIALLERAAKRLLG